jgi:hypothetical protein
MMKRVNKKQVNVEYSAHHFNIPASDPAISAISLSGIWSSTLGIGAGASGGRRCRRRGRMLKAKDAGHWGRMLIGAARLRGRCWRARPFAAPRQRERVSERHAATISLTLSHPARKEHTLSPAPSNGRVEHVCDPNTLLHPNF